MSTVRTRFAPSPTGYMHIGGMRTALFNWLWARHNHGQFVLRIDDTDQERNIGQALEPILRAFKWLGLDWDEGPEIDGPCGAYFQSQRGDLYRAAYERLLDEGKAYRCFDTPQQIQSDRESAQQQGQNYLNIRRSPDLTELQINDHLHQGDSYVIRFLVDRNRQIEIDDAVRGHVEWDAGLISDPVIARSNGSPLYNFATTVDDAQMNITHVIRAEEHLSNTPIQVMLHQALGNTLPQFAHIPFVAAPGSKQKLSKRKLDKYRKNPQFKTLFERADRIFPQIGLSDTHGGLDPVMVEYYERIGYLPIAVVNALARLGWSLDDRTEIMSRQTIVENFGLDRVVKGPAGLDPDKLNSFQAHWMGQLSLDERTAGCVPFLENAGFDVGPSGLSRSYLSQIVSALGDRLKVFSDILDNQEFFVADGELSYDEKAFEKRIRKPDAGPLLTAFKQQLANTEPFDATTLEAMMHSFVAAQEVKLGQIIHAVRVAVTGRPAGIGMFDCLAILGRDKCLARIDRALAALED